MLALPLFALSIGLNFVNFGVVWRYFGWANQMLAAVALWTGAVFLARRRSHWWMAFLPAVFMTVVTTTYILVENVGFGLPHEVGTVLGLFVGLTAAVAFLWVRPKLPPEDDRPTVKAHPSETERAGDSLAC